MLDKLIATTFRLHRIARSSTAMFVDLLLACHLANATCAIRVSPQFHVTFDNWFETVELDNEDLDERMTPHLSIQDDIPMCQECGRDSSKHPRWLSAKQMNDDYNSIRLTPKTSNKSKNTTLSGPQIVRNVALNNADFNEERTNRRNVPNTADFNRSCASEFGQEKQLLLKETRRRNEIKSWKTDLTIPGIYESEFQIK